MERRIRRINKGDEVEIIDDCLLELSDSHRRKNKTEKYNLFGKKGIVKKINICYGYREFDKFYVHIKRYGIFEVYKFSIKLIEYETSNMEEWYEE